jgi:hypothetical protein
MRIERSFWLRWAQFLHHWGLTEFVATLLEAMGPLNILFAQFVFIGQPFLGKIGSPNQWEALASLLENQEESQTFAAFLREGNSQ